ncbi:MAG: hypothetical protein V7647_2197 [Acidobacteriota bacterium]|jgi:hypothetical protein
MASPPSSRRLSLEELRQQIVEAAIQALKAAAAEHKANPRKQFLSRKATEALQKSRAKHHPPDEPLSGK